MDKLYMFFQRLCMRLTCKSLVLQVMVMLDRLYCSLDSLTSKYNLFKVETIGDAYMVVGNLRHPQHDHAAQVARFGMEAVKAATGILANEDDLEMG